MQKQRAAEQDEVPIDSSTFGMNSKYGTNAVS